MEAAEAVVPAVVLNTKDSGTFHGRRLREKKRSGGVTKSSPEKNIEIVNHQCHFLNKEYRVDPEKSHSQWWVQKLKNDILVAA